MAKRKQHELVGFLAIWAVQFAEDHNLDGLHPTHYDLMVKYGARMDDFKRAEICSPSQTFRSSQSASNQSPTLEKT